MLAWGLCSYFLIHHDGLSMKYEPNLVPIITEQQDYSLWCNVTVMITCDIIVKSGKNIIAVNNKVLKKKKMFLDCLSLLHWEVFRFCNVFKVVASCSLSFFFRPFLNNPKLRLLQSRWKKIYVYLGYAYDILPQIQTQTHLKCINDAYNKD